jgi:16S rRNA processing protein RimM
MPGDSFRVKDLDGCEVVTESGEVLGVLKDVYATGANDVFVVRRAPRPAPTAPPGAATQDEKEYLVPALKEVVLSIDQAAKRIVVRLPPGLREVYED